MNKSSNKLRITVLLVSSLTIMSMITISPALPKMSLEFVEVENAEFLVKLVMTLPALFIAFFSPITGQLIDKHGRLKFLYASLVLYAIAGTSGFYLSNIYFILIGRAIFGIAVGFSMTIINTLVADYFEGPQRQKFVGIQVAFMSLGGILFVGLGGFLSDISWRMPFLIYLFSLAVLPMALAYLYEPKSSSNNANTGIQKKSDNIIWFLFINMMLMWILFFLIPVQIPFHLKVLGVETNTLIGAAIAISTLFSAISSFAYSKLKDKFSFYSIFTVGYLLMAIAFFSISMANSYILVVFAMIVSGLGMGMMIPNTTFWVMKIAPPEIRGKEIGRLTTFWFFGQFISPILLFPIAKIYSTAETFFIAALFLAALSIIFLALQLISGQPKTSTT